MQTGIVLQVNANPTLIVTLQLGQLAETVTVQGTAALVETRNPGIGQVITESAGRRSCRSTAASSPKLVFQAGLATGGKGTADAPGGNALNTGVRSYPNTTIVVAGGLSNGMTYLLDGGTHNDPFNNLNLPLPFPDAMQEFKVETSALLRRSAATIRRPRSTPSPSRGPTPSMAMRFEFMRDHRLNAANAFAAIGPDGKRRDDGLHRDQFGGTLGGPIVQGKLFFFGGYQGTRDQRDADQLLPVRADGGDARRRLLDDHVAGVQLGPHDRAARPFAGTTSVAGAQFSPAALALAAKLPKPINDCGQSFFDRQTESIEHMALGRVDYQWNNNHSIFGRYQLAQLTSQPDNDPNNVLAYANGPIDDTGPFVRRRRHLSARLEHGELVPR